MKDKIVTVFRLATLPAVAVVPFMVMHGKGPNCSYINNSSVCVFSDDRPHVLIQLAVFIAAAAVVYAGYKLWQSQLNRSKKLAERKKYVLVNLALALLATLGAVRAYVDIRENHSQDSERLQTVIQGHQVNGHPFFGVGLMKWTFILLVVAYLAPYFVSFYQLFLSKKRIAGLKKDDLFQ